MGTASEINIAYAVAGCHKLFDSNIGDLAAVSQMKVMKVLSESADTVDSIVR